MGLSYNRTGPEAKGGANFRQPRAIWVRKTPQRFRRGTRRPSPAQKSRGSIRVYCFSFTWASQSIDGQWLIEISVGRLQKR
jgi:hypothetical protein